MTMIIALASDHAGYDLKTKVILPAPLFSFVALEGSQAVLAVLPSGISIRVGREQRWFSSEPIHDRPIRRPAKQGLVFVLAVEINQDQPKVL